MFNDIVGGDRVYGSECDIDCLDFGELYCDSKCNDECTEGVYFYFQYVDGMFVEVNWMNYIAEIGKPGPEPPF